MNLAGKILAVMILIMSIVFFVISIMAAASVRNWKEQAMQNAAEVQRLRDLNEQAKQDQTRANRQLQAEMVSRQQQLAQLFSQYEIERQNYNAKAKELDQEHVVSQARLRELEKAELRLAQQDQAIAEQRELNKNLIDEIATRRAEVVNLTTQIHQLKGQLDSLETLNRDMSEQLALAIKVLNHNGLTTASLTGHIPPKVDGLVTEVSDDLISIGLGSDDGLRAGHRMDIYRSDRFIGKAEVIQTRPDNAVARILPEFSQAVVLQGDHVTTKF